MPSDTDKGDITLPASCCLIAFDIDNCLMPVDQPPTETVRRGLLDLQAAGAHIVFASGKPCLYLAGLTRGLGLMDTSLIGENGAETWVTCTMPPQRLTDPPTTAETAALQALREELAAHYGKQRIFFQPNAVGVTVFPMPGTLTAEQVAAETDGDLPNTIQRYVHVDSVDWVIARYDKGKALLRLAEHLAIAQERLAAVGDSSNDLPMIREAALALWVGDPANLDHQSAHVVPDIESALACLRGWV